MKEHKQQMMLHFRVDVVDDPSEAIAQHTLSIRNLESCIMRQGMVLKNIGNPDPHPESKNSDNTIVHPTADNIGL